MKSLSEYFVNDLPEGALLPEYPSTSNPKASFVNRVQYRIHESIPIPEENFLKTLGPHHIISAWGDALPVTIGIEPSKALQDHWQESLGMSVRFTPLEAHRRYVTLFPHEQLTPAMHCVDPDVHYELLSKALIPKIDCPQPKTVKPHDCPYVMKISHGYSGYGNFFIHSLDDHLAAEAGIERYWPGVECFYTEIVTPITGDYCTQFYVDRSGGIQWIGVTQQTFNRKGYWAGAKIQGTQQETLRQLLLPAVKPIADYLHKHGYFGVVGVDVLKDDTGQLYVIDINARINGSTPFLIMYRSLQLQGFAFGGYYPSLTFRGSVTELLQTFPEESSLKMVVLSTMDAPQYKGIQCHIGLFGDSEVSCEAFLQKHFYRSV